MSRVFGVGSLISLAIAFLCFSLFNTVLPVYVLFAFALALSALAGIRGSRKWFFLTGFLTLALFLFLGFVAMVMEGSRVGG
jgi:hypothetical protein